jgi:hypothetical protein
MPTHAYSSRIDTFKSKLPRSQDICLPTLGTRADWVDYKTAFRCSLVSKCGWAPVYFTKASRHKSWQFLSGTP